MSSRKILAATFLCFDTVWLHPKYCTTISTFSSVHMRSFCGLPWRVVWETASLLMPLLAHTHLALIQPTPRQTLPLHLLSSATAPKFPLRPPHPSSSPGEHLFAQ